MNDSTKHITFTIRLRAFWRKYLKALWLSYEWPLVWAAGVFALYLGVIGFEKHFTAFGEQRSILDNLYLSLQLFLLESGAVSGPIAWELEVARLLAPLVAAYTATQALAVLFKNQLRQFRVRFISDHVVICGLGKMGAYLTKTFHERGFKVIVIEKDAGNDNFEYSREHGALAFVGDATNLAVLQDARVHKARYLIAVCGNDGINAEVSVLARQLAKDRKRAPLICLVHIVDLNLCQLLQEREIVLRAESSFRLEFFNILESGVRAMLSEYPPFGKTSYSASLMVVGLGRMGEGLVLRVAREWREDKRPPTGRLRITIVDRDAERKVQNLYLQYPQLSKVCELHAAQIEIRSLDFQKGEFLFSSNGKCELSCIYVCVDDDSTGLSAALFLLHGLRGRRIPVVVRMRHESGLSALLRGEGDYDSFDNLHAFGLLTRTCNPDLLLGGTNEILARALHADYVHHHQELGETPETNPSMVPWETLPENLKESNRQLAGHIGTKLNAAGYSIAPLTDWDAELFKFSEQEVELMAALEYARWHAERKEKGWTYAPGPKNTTRKTTPHMIPWPQLSDEVKELDRITVRGLPKFLASAGFQIYRIKKDSR
jgi:hypothetical protein